MHTLLKKILIRMSTIIYIIVVQITVNTIKSLWLNIIIYFYWKKTRSQRAISKEIMVGVSTIIYNSRDTHHDFFWILILRFWRWLMTAFFFYNLNTRIHTFFQCFGHFQSIPRRRACSEHTRGMREVSWFLWYAQNTRPGVVSMGNC